MTGAGAQPMTARKLESLQVLRAIAAALVVLDHVASDLLQRCATCSFDIRALWFAGAFGVQMFFCISGYIITQSLFGMIARGQTVGDFYLRRGIRVAPLYWLATAVLVAGLALRGRAPGWDELLKSVFFIPFADAHGNMRPVLGLGWSLNFEMFFYLVFGLGLLIRGTRGPAIAVLPILALWVASRFVPAPELARLPEALRLLVDPILGYFVAGVAIAYAEAAMARPNGLAWLTVPRVATASFVLVAFLVATVLASPAALPAAEMARAVVAIGLVAACALQAPNPGRPGRLLDLGTRFGDASYCTYLTHVFLINAVVTALVAVVPAARGSTGLALALSTAVIPLFCLAGLAVHVLVERPLLQALNSRLKSRTFRPARVAKGNA